MQELAAVNNPQSLPSKLLHSVPAEDDSEWTSRLYKIPDITFSTIYELLVDRKILLKRVSYLECIVDKRTEAVTRESQSDRVIAKLDPSSSEQSGMDASKTDDVNFVPVE